MGGACRAGRGLLRRQYLSPPAGAGCSLRAIALSAPYALAHRSGYDAGLCGDCFIAGVLVALRGQNCRYSRIWPGAHLLHIGIFWLGSAVGSPWRHLRRLLLWWLIGLVGWYFIVYRDAVSTRLHWLVLALCHASGHDGRCGRPVWLNRSRPSGRWCWVRPSFC